MSRLEVVSSSKRFTRLEGDEGVDSIVNMVLVFYGNGNETGSGKR